MTSAAAAIRLPPQKLRTKPGVTSFALIAVTLALAACSTDPPPTLITVSEQRALGDAHQAYFVPIAADRK